MTPEQPIRSERAYKIGRMIGGMLGIGVLIVLLMRLGNIQIAPSPPPVSDSEKYFIDFAPIIGSAWQADPPDSDRRVLSKSIDQYTETLSRTTKHVELGEAYIRQEITSYWDTLAASRSFRIVQGQAVGGRRGIGSIFGASIESFESELRQVHFIACRDAHYKNFDLVNCEAGFLCKDRVFRVAIQTRSQNRESTAKLEIARTLQAVDEACSTITIS